MKKYVIKNYPNLLFKKGVPACGLTWKLTSPNEYFDNYIYCKDVTDCLLKQIVDECKRVDCDCFDQWCFANLILEKLEIEEVNE